MQLRRLAILPLLLLALMLPAVSTPAFAHPVQPQAAQPDAGKLDLNLATPDQIKALPGIGDVYTKRIIDGRPYSAKNQLITRGILPQATYEKIKDRIVAHRAVKK